ncbi:uncharacterized protein METZ01_LOCUS162587 [marine metagenome]|uniref:Uncharacterized protein n=1 Tax=marine metagenome TaxID=408172 RepID=A0A382B911_9ZZZZ
MNFLGIGLCRNHDFIDLFLKKTIPGISSNLPPNEIYGPSL